MDRPPRPEVVGEPGGRRLAAPLPGREDDRGEVDPALATALAAHGAEPARPDLQAEVLAALLASRLLVPVVAVLGEVEVDEHGLAHDKTSDMATVLLTGADGRTALLAFSGSAAMTAWDPAARPVPTTAQVAAQTAVQDGAAALLLDVAGPVPFVVQGDDLLAVARGWRLTRVGDRSAWVAPAEPGAADGAEPGIGRAPE